MKATTYDAVQLMHEGALALAEAERNGLCIDVDYCKKTIRRIDRRCSTILEDLQDSELFLAGRKKYRSQFNHTSNDQLAELLFNVMKYTPTKKTATGKPGTDEESLKATGQGDIIKLLELRKIEKIKTTYIGGFMKEQVNGSMHPFFHLHSTRTFRSSSANPNFQNIPNRDPELKALARKAILPRPGHLLLCADFSGAEVRVATCYHKDPTMIAYNNDDTKDMHRDMAMECFLLPQDQIIKPVRNNVKGAFVFAQFYGDWWKSCAEGLWSAGHDATQCLKNGTPLIQHLKGKGLGTLEKFEQHIKGVEHHFWYDRFPQYLAWKEQWWEDYQAAGYFDTLTGFRCQGIMSRNDAINYPVQGSAFHCMLWCFVQLSKIAKQQKWKSRLVGQIHDEVVMDVHPDELKMVCDTIKRVMEVDLPKQFKWIIVPIIVEIEGAPVNESWNEKGKLDLNTGLRKAA